jgi:hypothetical protein
MKGGEIKNQPHTMAFSRDGRWLASGGTDAVIYIWEVATGKEISRFRGHDGEISLVTFGPDGRTLSSFANDGQGYVWSLRPKEKPLHGRTFADLWDVLDKPDAAAAFHAQWQMVTAANESVSFLRERLVPASAIDGVKIRQWISEIDNAKFPVRDAATKALEDAGHQVRDPIQKALEGEVTLETRRRLEYVLNKLEAIPVAVQTARAIQVLELIGSPDARGVLEAMGRGAPGARITEEATAALIRLAKLPIPSP